MSHGAQTSGYPKARRRRPTGPYVAQRACIGLLCKNGETFLSEGPWNRTCPKCKARRTNNGRDPEPPTAHVIRMTATNLPYRFYEER